MSLNVISNYAANVAQRHLQKADEEATRSLAKLSSGTRVISARDDAASLAVATSIRADVSALKQAAVNAGQAASMLQIADGAMGTVTDMLVRAKSLAVQAASDQLTNAQRAMVATEFTALQDEIDRISQSTRFDGQTLLAGTGAAGTSSIAAANVSASNQSNKFSAFAYEFNEDNLRFGNATIGIGTLGGYNAAKVAVTVNGVTSNVTMTASAPADAAAAGADLQVKLRTVTGLSAATVTVSGTTATINSGAADKAITALTIVQSNDAAIAGSPTAYARQAFNLVSAKVGSTELNFELATASGTTIADVVTSLNADKLFRQYFLASSEKVNNDTSKGRFYLTALTSDPLTSFSIKSRAVTGGAANGITGVAAADIKVGQSATYDMGSAKIASADKLAFTLGGTGYEVKVADLKNWATEVSNVVAVSGTADNQVAAQKQRMEFDLTGLLTINADTLSVTIGGTTKTTDRASGQSVADVVDAFITAHQSSFTSDTLSREGNRLVVTANTAGTGFTMGSVNAEKGGATPAVEVVGTTTQENRTAASVGFTSDGKLVRKNGATVQSANTTTELTTNEALTFLASYINDSSTAPHLIGSSVIASVSNDNKMVLTARAGTVGSQASFSTGGYSSTTSSAAFEVVFQIGARNTEHERLKVNIANVSTANLKVDKTAAKVDTAANALSATTSLNTALDNMAMNRANIGAQQNRLDFAATNIASTIENQEAARSNLMDLDVAAEMSYFTSRQILQQAGVSMLAQANQMPQNLLRLFR